MTKVVILVLMTYTNGKVVAQELNVDSERACHQIGRRSTISGFDGYLCKVEDTYRLTPGN
jgi:hypothetical protein